MFARRFANRGLGRIEKMKPDVDQLGGVLKEHNGGPNKQNAGFISKLPVKSHKQQVQKFFFKSVASKRDGRKTKHDTRTILHKSVREVHEIEELPEVCDEEEEEEDSMDDTYARDIHAYLKSIELKCCPSLLRNGITGSNRRVLLAWMRDVQDYLDVHQETFQLAVTIVDITVATASVKLQEYQLLGLVGFFIAAKFFERYIPEIDTLVYLASYAYDSNLILYKEREVLRLLDYDLNLPTASWFLEYYGSEEESVDEVRQLAESFVDLFSLNTPPSVSQLRPSLRAASALSVAKQLCGPPKRSQRDLLPKSGHSQLEILTTNERLRELIEGLRTNKKRCSIEDRVVALLPSLL